MARLLFQLPKVDPSQSVRIDTASGSDSAADIQFTNATSVASSTLVADQNGALPPVLGPDGVSTLYLKKLTYKGTVTGSAVTLTGQSEVPVQPGSATYVPFVQTDGQFVYDGAITSGQAVLTSAAAKFSAVDVGKYVMVGGAGAGGLDLCTTILEYQSPTQVTLAANAGATVTGAEVVWGSDQLSKINAALVGGGCARLKPLPYWINGSATHTAGSQLIGCGWSTSIALAPAANVSMVTLADSTVFGTCTADLRLLGNRTAQSTTSRGVSLDNSLSPNGTRNGPYGQDPDPNHLLRNVYARDTFSTSFYLANHAQETTLDRCFSFRSGGYGFYTNAADCAWIACVAEWADVDGFRIDGNGHRLTNCKAFQNGRVGSGYGYNILSTALLTRLVNCMAEQNQSAGFHFAAARMSAIGCQSQSDGKDLASAAFFFDGCTDSDFLLEIDNWDITSKYAMQFANSADRNNIRLTGRVAAMGSTSLLTGSTLTNSIKLNNEDATEPVAYTASYTPGFGTGAHKVMTLTGNVTVNAPAVSWNGRKLVLQFIQDATGGRTVTFGAGIKANWTPDTTANKTNTVTLEYDGTNYVQLAAATGL